MKIIMKQGYEVTDEIKDMIKCYTWSSPKSGLTNKEIRENLGELGVEYFGWDIQEINYKDIIQDIDNVLEMDNIEQIKESLILIKNRL